MSLTYTEQSFGGVFWMFAIALGVGLHVGLPLQIIKNTPVEEAAPPEPDGITGAVLFDLSDIVAAPSALAEDSVAQAETEEAPTVTESPEVVDPAKAADNPLLSQIPYEVDDESLKFAVAAPDSEIETDEVATEVAAEQDPEKVDVASQVGAEQADAAAQSTAGAETETVAETTEAKSEGLTPEETEEIREWQKSIVLMISEAKTYPKEARKNRTTGEVQVRFTLDVYGTVIAAEVAQSSGSTVLDRAAVETVLAIGKMPTPPSYLPGETFSLLIPLRYRFR